MKNKRTLQEVADKLDWEGGIGEGVGYFGREINTDDIDFNGMWRVLFDAFKAIEERLPEPSVEEE